MPSTGHNRPITIAMLALGGQGGGVLTRWLVDLAEANGYLAQSTYVAGVAQRTGATVYCVEIYPKDKLSKDSALPVFTPYPVPGDVDLVIAGEMAETGRALQKGFVTPNVTTLISSSHRVYSITEKEAMGDGILDQSPVARVAEQVAKRFICFDMEEAAAESGSVISAVMFGAIAGTGALPFTKDAYEQTIRDTGRGVEVNLTGFAAGLRGATEGRSKTVDDDVRAVEPVGENGEALAARIAKELPASVGDIALHGALRALDYQDKAYADTYLDMLVEVTAKESESTASSQNYELTTEIARQLALQMCYEDTIRVADLKTRKDRMQRVRDQVSADENQPVHIVEYFHPRVEEVCDTLPAPLGRYILNSPRILKMVSPLISKGRNIRTSTISGFLMLYLLGKFKRWRLGTYRFSVQQQLISNWLKQINTALKDDYDYALAVAQCIEMVKGYGDTYQRGLTRYQEILSIARRSSRDRASVVRQLRVAAEGDEKGLLFAKVKSGMETIH